MSREGAHAGLFVENRDGLAAGRIDARVRLVACLAYLLCLPLLHQPIALAGAVLIGLGTNLWARVPAQPILSRILATEAFLIALLVTMPFVVPGEPMLTFAGLTASWDGLWRAFAIMARITAGALVVLALLGQLGGEGLATAMVGIGAPRRLAQILQMTIRYGALFKDEYHLLRRALLVRGFRPASNWHTVVTLGNLIGMLLVRSLERAERVRGAMLCRGYTGHFAAQPSRPLAAPDIGFALAGLGILMTLLGLQAWL